jgi:DNA-directed RNA polymerase subunit L
MATEVEMEDKISFKKKQEVLYPIIDEIKEIADKLIENYILYIKNKDDLRRMESLRDDINTILEKIDIFKEKIYELYEMEK